MKKRILALSMVVALLAVIAVPIATTANAGGTVITGNIASTATLTKPSDINLGTLHVGLNSANSTAGSVVANGTGWTLTVSDTKTVTKGYMTLGGADNTAELNYPLTVCTTSNGSFGTIAEYQALLQGSIHYGEVTTFSIPLFVQQQILAGDQGGSYSITLTFTATPGT